MDSNEFEMNLQVTILNEPEVDTQVVNESEVDAHVIMVDNEFVQWIYEWLETLPASNETKWLLLVQVMEEHSPVMDSVLNEDWVML